MKREEIIQEIKALFEGKTQWDYQCPPENRGAQIALMRLLGISWKEANMISLGKRTIGGHFTFGELLEDIEKAEAQVPKTTAVKPRR